MPELMRFDLPDETSVLVEVEPDGPEISPVSRAGDVIDSATSTLHTSLAQVRKAAAVALNTFRDQELRPDTVNVELGVKLTAEAGAVIAKTGTAGHLKVSLTWHRDPAGGSDTG